MASSRRRRGGGPEWAANNWERLVWAVLKWHQDHLRAGGAAGGLGLAAAVPASLSWTTNIEQILHAADDIEDEDPNIERIRKQSPIPTPHLP
jgi:callose synthase